MKTADDCLFPGSNFPDNLPKCLGATRSQRGFAGSKVKLDHAVFHDDTGGVAIDKRPGDCGRYNRYSGNTGRCGGETVPFVDPDTDHQGNHQRDQRKHHTKDQALVVIILRKHRRTLQKLARL